MGCKDLSATFADIWKRYGARPDVSDVESLDKMRIPIALWPLIPYAEFWGLADDWERETLVKSSSEDAIQDLKAVVDRFDDELDKWLAGDEADITHPSREYVAFSAMRMAADFA